MNRISIVEKNSFYSGEANKNELSPAKKDDVIKFQYIQRETRDENFSLTPQPVVSDDASGDAGEAPTMRTVGEAKKEKKDKPKKDKPKKDKPDKPDEPKDKKADKPDKPDKANDKKDDPKPEENEPKKDKKPKAKEDKAAEDAAADAPEEPKDAKNKKDKNAEENTAAADTPEEPKDPKNKKDKNTGANASEENAPADETTQESDTEEADATKKNKKAKKNEPPAPTDEPAPATEEEADPENPKAGAKKGKGKKQGGADAKADPEPLVTAQSGPDDTVDGKKPPKKDPEDPEAGVALDGTADEETKKNKKKGKGGKDSEPDPLQLNTGDDDANPKGKKKNGGADDGPKPLPLIADDGEEDTKGGKKKTGIVDGGTETPALLAGDGEEDTKGGKKKNKAGTTAAPLPIDPKSGDAKVVKRLGEKGFEWDGNNYVKTSTNDKGQKVVTTDNGREATTVVLGKDGEQLSERGHASHFIRVGKGQNVGQYQTDEGQTVNVRFHQGKKAPELGETKVETFLNGKGERVGRTKQMSTAKALTKLGLIDKDQQPKEGTVLEAVQNIANGEHEETKWGEFYQAVWGGRKNSKHAKEVKARFAEGDFSDLPDVVFTDGKTPTVKLGKQHQGAFFAGDGDNPNPDLRDPLLLIKGDLPKKAKKAAVRNEAFNLFHEVAHALDRKKDSPNDEGARFEDALRQLANDPDKAVNLKAVELAGGLGPKVRDVGTAKLFGQEVEVEFKTPDASRMVLERRDNPLEVGIKDGTLDENKVIGAPDSLLQNKRGKFVVKAKTLEGLLKVDNPDEYAQRYSNGDTDLTVNGLFGDQLQANFGNLNQRDTAKVRNAAFEYYQTAHGAGPANKKEKEEAVSLYLGALAQSRGFINLPHGVARENEEVVFVGDPLIRSNMSVARQVLSERAEAYQAVKDGTLDKDVAKAMFGDDFIDLEGKVRINAGTNNERVVSLDDLNKPVVRNQNNSAVTVDFDYELNGKKSTATVNVHLKDDNRNNVTLGELIPEKHRERAERVLSAYADYVAKSTVNSQTGSKPVGILEFANSGLWKRGAEDKGVKLEKNEETQAFVASANRFARHLAAALHGANTNIEDDNLKKAFSGVGPATLGILDGKFVEAVKKVSGDLTLLGARAKVKPVVDYDWPIQVASGVVEAGDSLHSPVVDLKTGFLLNATPTVRVLEHQNTVGFQAVTPGDKIITTRSGFRARRDQGPAIVDQRQVDPQFAGESHFDLATRLSKELTLQRADASTAVQMFQNGRQKPISDIVAQQLIEGGITLALSPVPAAAVAWEIFKAAKDDILGPDLTYDEQKARDIAHWGQDWHNAFGNADEPRDWGDQVKVDLEKLVDAKKKSTVDALIEFGTGVAVLGVSRAVGNATKNLVQGLGKLGRAGLGAAKASDDAAGAARAAAETPDDVIRGFLNIPKAADEAGGAAAKAAGTADDAAKSGAKIVSTEAIKSGDDAGRAGAAAAKTGKAGAKAGKAGAQAAGPKAGTTVGGKAVKASKDGVTVKINPVLKATAATRAATKALVKTLNPKRVANIQTVANALGATTTFATQSTLEYVLDDGSSIVTQIENLGKAAKAAKKLIKTFGNISEITQTVINGFSSVKDLSEEGIEDLVARTLPAGVNPEWAMLKMAQIAADTIDTVTGTDNEYADNFFERALAKLDSSVELKTKATSKDEFGNLVGQYVPAGRNSEETTIADIIAGADAKDVNAAVQGLLDALPKENRAKQLQGNSVVGLWKSIQAATRGEGDGETVEIDGLNLQTVDGHANPNAWYVSLDDDGKVNYKDGTPTLFTTQSATGDDLLEDLVEHVFAQAAGKKAAKAYGQARIDPETGEAVGPKDFDAGKLILNILEGSGNEGEGTLNGESVEVAVARALSNKELLQSDLVPFADGYATGAVNFGNLARNAAEAVKKGGKAAKALNRQPTGRKAAVSAVVGLAVGAGAIAANGKPKAGVKGEGFTILVTGFNPQFRETFVTPVGTNDKGETTGGKIFTRGNETNFQMIWPFISGGDNKGKPKFGHAIATKRDPETLRPEDEGGTDVLFLPGLRVSVGVTAVPGEVPVPFTSSKNPFNQTVSRSGGPLRDPFDGMLNDQPFPAGDFRAKPKELKGATVGALHFDFTGVLSVNYDKDHVQIGKEFIESNLVVRPEGIAISPEPLNVLFGALFKGAKFLAAPATKAAGAAGRAVTGKSAAAPKADRPPLSTDAKTRGDTDAADINVNDFLNQPEDVETPRAPAGRRPPPPRTPSPDVVRGSGGAIAMITFRDRARTGVEIEPTPDPNTGPGARPREPGGLPFRPHSGNTSAAVRAAEGRFLRAGASTVEGGHNPFTAGADRRGKNINTAALNALFANPNVKFNWNGDPFTKGSQPDAVGFGFDAGGVFIGVGQTSKKKGKALTFAEQATGAKITLGDGAAFTPQARQRLIREAAAAAIRQPEGRPSAVAAFDLPQTPPLRQFGPTPAGGKATKVGSDTNRFSLVAALFFGTSMGVTLSAGEGGRGIAGGTPNFFGYDNRREKDKRAEAEDKKAKPQQPSTQTPSTKVPATDETTPGQPTGPVPGPGKKSSAVKVKDDKSTAERIFDITSRVFPGEEGDKRGSAATRRAQNVVESVTTNDGGATAELEAIKRGIKNRGTRQTINQIVRQIEKLPTKSSVAGKATEEIITNLETLQKDLQERYPDRPTRAGRVGRVINQLERPYTNALHSLTFLAKTVEEERAATDAEANPKRANRLGFLANLIQRETNKVTEEATTVGRLRTSVKGVFKPGSEEAKLVQGAIDGLNAPRQEATLSLAAFGGDVRVALEAAEARGDTESVGRLRTALDAVEDAQSDVQNLQAAPRALNRRGFRPSAVSVQKLEEAKAAVAAAFPDDPGRVDALDSIISTYTAGPDAQVATDLSTLMRRLEDDLERSREAGRRSRVNQLEVALDLVRMQLGYLG